MTNYNMVIDAISQELHTVYQQDEWNDQPGEHLIEKRHSDRNRAQTKLFMHQRQ